MTTSGVVALDRLSERLLARAAPLRVDVTTDLEPIHRLRYAQVVGAGWARPAELPGEVERDDYDDVAVHVAAWDRDALVGAIRVVPPVPGRRLPVEDAFGLEVPPAGAVAEIGRLLIAPGYRGDPAHRAWGALFARSWLECRRLGATVLAGSTTPAWVERYRAIGLEFEVLGPARPHWGEERVPVRLDPARDGAPGWFTPSPGTAGSARR
jgi:N-acyl-L-homoserine lactone synthetase